MGEGKTLPPFYLDKHKRLLKLLREFRDNEEGYEVVLAEFEKFLNLEEESLRYRAMAFDVMRTSALENPRDLRYEPYIRKLVERLLSYDIEIVVLLYDEDLQVRLCDFIGCYKP